MAITHAQAPAFAVLVIRFEPNFRAVLVRVPSAEATAAFCACQPTRAFLFVRRRNPGRSEWVLISRLDQSLLRSQGSALLKPRKRALTEEQEPLKSSLTPLPSRTPGGSSQVLPPWAMPAA